MAQQDHKLPTAKQFLLNKNIRWADPEEMIEFAKLHVEAALKKANKNAQIELGHCYECGGSTMLESQNTILNAYPLTNIK